MHLGKIQKNMEISHLDASNYLRAHGVSTDKPLITQISRYDKWKDPEGVIKVFTIVKEKFDCRLVLCGNMATDDPEVQEIYERIKGGEAKELIARGDIICLTDPLSSNYFFINALQRVFSVILRFVDRGNRIESVVETTRA